MLYVAPFIIPYILHTLNEDSIFARINLNCKYSSGTLQNIVERDRIFAQDTCYGEGGDFHIQYDEGNFHKEYTSYIQKQLDGAMQGLKDAGALTPENAKAALSDIISDTRKKIEQGVKDGAKTLDEVFSSKK